MRNISKISIDDKEFENKLLIKDSKNITFYYNKTNEEEEEHLIKLERLAHYYDRDSTIKFKNLFFEIKEIECPEFTRPYHGECVSCYILSRYNLINPLLKWTQDGLCVERCDYDKGYAIYNSKNFYCSKCAEKTIIFEPMNGGFAYICSCSLGNVKSFEDQICYLPEDEAIIKLRNILSKAQCYQANGETHNYCSKHTISCYIKNKNGYNFPFCNCEKGYKGRYCEFEENNIDLSKQLDEI